MKRVRRYIAKNWFWIAAGLLLTAPAVKMAYAQRGYVAYGGEWLVLPLILLAVETARNISSVVSCLLTWEDGNDED